jgi:C-terminal processing protease CtpA/Prc
LTSKQTVSAGEILVMAMKACPTVTTLGETTLGILSDNLYKRLPNGWEISLSNEVYESADGKIYEAVGIAPDIDVPVFDAKNVMQGFRVAVDRALEIIQSRVAS